MSEMLIIVKREFMERVHTRSFLVGTILFPVFMIAMMLAPHYFGSSGSQRKFALVDEAPAGVSDRFVESLTAPRESDKDNTYAIERVSGSLESVRERLNANVETKAIDGYVVLPANVLDSNKIMYRARNIAGLSVLKDLRISASRAVQGERLRQAGLDGAKVATLIKSVEVDGARITSTGEEGGDAISTFFLAYIVAFLIYLLTLLYGVSVMRSVLEEKTNRIAEVLVSSVKPAHLMAGKIIGVASAAILQVLIWAAIIALLATQSDAIAKRLGIDASTMKAFAVEPWVGVALVLFFILGFLLFSSMFAALGAAVTSEQEAQSLQMVLMLPMFIPLIFIGPITGEPLGRVATILGLVPFTAPLTMPMRMAAGQIPRLQVLLSLALLVVGIALTAWIAGKIYRVGILSTGKKPTLKELGRWMRMA